MNIDLLQRVVAALDAAGIAHMVTGSLASAHHGEPRATRDIDVVIDPDERTIELLVAEFPTGRFYLGDARTAVATRDMFNIIDTESGWKVDLMIRKDRPFSRSEFDRRQPTQIASVDTFITTPEDAILSKLEWQTLSASDTQRRDVIQMMVANLDDLDVEYLQRWAEDLGVLALLDQLWAEASAQR